VMVSGIGTLMVFLRRPHTCWISPVPFAFEDDSRHVSLVAAVGPQIVTTSFPAAMPASIASWAWTI
jgi:hypothetical protein